jgi:hypothetical protein
MKVWIELEKVGVETFIQRVVEHYACKPSG